MGRGRGRDCKQPLLDRTRPYTPPHSGAAGDLALPRPAELPRVAVRAEQGGVPGDQGGPYYDYGGVWGADPVGETPKPYLVETAQPLPVHWGQGEGESIADDTAYDEEYNEVRVYCAVQCILTSAHDHAIAPSSVQWCKPPNQVNKQWVSAAGCQY